jgi:WD40 repeat protein
MILVLALGATVDDDASGPRRDSWGDPLPAQAVARLGTARFRGVGPGSAAALAPDGKRLVVAGQQGLFFWDLTTGHVTKTLPHQEIAHGLSFAPDGKILAVTAFNAPIRLLDPETGRILQQLTAAGKIVDAANVEFSLDGAFLSASQDRKPAALCHVWEVATGKHLGAFAGLHDSSGHTAPGPGGRLLLSWGECANPRDLRGFVQVLDVKSGTPLRSFKVGPYPPSGALSPDGRIFAACADTESVSLWDVASGIVARELSGLRGIWGKMRFSPDGKLLAAGAGPGTVVVWDLTTGKRLDAGAGPRSSTWFFRNQTRCWHVASMNTRFASGTPLRARKSRLDRVTAAR